MIGVAEIVTRRVLRGHRPPRLTAPSLNKLIVLVLSMLPAIVRGQPPTLVGTGATTVTNQTVQLSWQVGPGCRVFVPAGGHFPAGCPSHFSVYRGHSAATMGFIGTVNPTAGAEYPPHAPPVSGVNWLPIIAWSDPAPDFNASVLYAICADGAPATELGSCATTTSVLLIGIPSGTFVPSALVSLANASPATGLEAIGTFQNRAEAYVENMACGREFEFLHDLQNAHFDPTQISNGKGVTDALLTFALAKLQWLKLNAGRSCATPLPSIDNLGVFQAFVPLLLPTIPYLSAQCGSDGVTFPPDPAPRSPSRVTVCGRRSTIRSGRSGVAMRYLERVDCRAISGRQGP